MIRPVDALLEFLRAQQARGRTHLHLDPEARQGLRKLHEAVRAARQAPGTAVATAVSPGSVPAEAALVRLAALEMTAAAEPEAPAPTVPDLVVTGNSRVERLESVRRQAESWSPARRLGTLREVMVFSTGNPDARIMLVGEAPGYEEERKLEPFVGPAGQQLDKILLAMGLARSDVYISNIVKFRPATARQSTNNRPPTPDEIAACLPLLREEVRIIQPACIVALGGSAATGLLGGAGSVGDLRGVWHESDGVPVRVTYHPSYLLRSTQDLRTRRMVWEDMLAVMEQTSMPISDRQRGYFLPKT